MLVNKKGSDWDTKLGPVLMAYRTTPQPSTGVSPFYLLYGRDAKLPSALNFYVPKPPAVTVESAYGKGEREQTQGRVLRIHKVHRRGSMTSMPRNQELRWVIW